MKLPRRLSEPGPLVDYVNMLNRLGQRKTALSVVRAVRSLLQTEDGATLLELLDKAVLERTMPVEADLGALAAINAQSFIALDLRRIASDDFEAALDDTSTTTGPRGRRRSGR